MVKVSYRFAKSSSNTFVSYEMTSSTGAVWYNQLLGIKADVIICLQYTSSGHGGNRDRDRPSHTPRTIAKQMFRISEIKNNTFHAAFDACSCGLVLAGPLQLEQKRNEVKSGASLSSSQMRWYSFPSLSRSKLLLPSPKS